MSIILARVCVRYMRALHARVCVRVCVRYMRAAFNTIQYKGEPMVLPVTLSFLLESHNARYAPIARFFGR